MSRRLDKEHRLYLSEAESNKIKLEKLKETLSIEEWDVKNAVSVYKRNTGPSLRSPID